MSAPSRRRSTGALFLLVASLLLALLFAVAHLAGWREHTSVLSGVHPGTLVQQIQGLCYAVAWILVTTVAPILAIAALITQLLAAAMTRESAPESP